MRLANDVTTRALVLSAFLLACNRTSPTPEAPVEKLQAALEFPAGDVQGTVSWYGAAVGPGNALRANGGAWISGVSSAGTYQALQVMPGDYTVTITSSFDCNGAILASGGVN